MYRALRKPQLLAIPATMLAILATTGCGGSDKSDASSTPTTPTAPTSSPASAPPSYPEEVGTPADTGAGSGSDSAASLGQGQVWHYEDQNGYTFKLTINFSEPQHADTEVTNPFDDSFVAGSACGTPGPQDAVIAGGFNVTSTTSGFDVAPAFKVAFGNDQLQAEVPFRVEHSLSDGPVCATESPDSTAMAGASWTQGFADGETQTVPFFVIIPDYYNPNNPDGDSARLKSYWMKAVDGTIATDGGGIDDIFHPKEIMDLLYLSG